MSEAVDFMKFVEKFMAEVPGGPAGDAEMRRRDPSPFVDTTAADIRPDTLTDDQIDSWFNYMAWNLWELIATRSTEGESGLIPRQEYETLSFVQQWSVNPNAYRIIAGAVGTDGLVELGRVPRREVGTKVNHIRNYASALMAMLGRGVCVSLDQLDPSIRRDDIEVCIQSARRLWHGTWGDGPGLASGRGFVLPLLDDDILQPLLAAAAPFEDDEARKAFRRFNATTELFGFLMHYDTRLGMGDTGPYPLPGGGFALIRDHFLDEQGYSWSTISDGLPYAVTEVLRFRPDPIELKINDIGTTFTKPADYLKSLDSVAVFARDQLDTPMSGIRQIGAGEMKRIVASCERGVLKMYKILSSKGRDEKIRDGIQMYSHEFMRPLAQRAGVWEQVLAGGFDELADATQAAWPILTGGRAAEILAPVFLMGRGFPPLRSPAAAQAQAS
jgi:hypothetical protein